MQITPNTDLTIMRRAKQLGLLCCVSFWLGCAIAGAATRAEAAQDADTATRTLVETVPAKQAAISQTIRAYGTVAAGGHTVTTVSVPYIARITKLDIVQGQTVRRGTPLFDVVADPAAIVAAGQAATAEGLAQRELARTRALFDARLATQSQLDTAAHALDDARTAAAAQHALGVRPGVVTVTAPADGVVLQLSAGQGDTLQAGTAVLQIAHAGSGDARLPNLLLNVEPADSAHVQVGDRVTVRPLAADESTRPVDATVVEVGASIDATSQMVNVGVRMSSAGTSLLPGARVSAAISTRPSMHWVVPRSALLGDDDDRYVFQVGPDQHAHRIRVTLHVESGNEYGVDGPLNPAWPVVSSGNYELDDQALVRTASEAHR